MNQTVYILLSCVDGISLCENVTLLKQGFIVRHDPIFWQWIKMWF